MVIYDGSGVATLYGDGGMDYLVTGTETTTAFMYGGDGKDYIVHNGSGTAVIHGGGDSDQLFGGAAADTIYGGDDTANLNDAGDEIYGRGGNAVIDGGPGSDIIYWSFEEGAVVTVQGGANGGIDTENDLRGDRLII